MLTQQQRITSFVLFAAVISFAPGGGRLRAQSPNVKYDWAAQAVVHTREVASGTTVQVVIANLNKVCYDYTITLAPVAAVESNKDFLSVFAAKPEDVDEQSLKSVEESVAKAGASAGILDLQKAAANAAPKDEEHLLAAETTYKRARKALAEATKPVNDVSAQRNTAQKAIESFYTTVCKPSYRADSSTVAGAWIDAKGPLDAFIGLADTKLVLVDSAVALSKRTLSEANELVVQVRKNATDAFLRANSSRLQDRDILHAALNAAIEKTSETVAKLKKESTESTSAKNAITTAIATSSYVQSVLLRDNTESISGTITATGKPGLSQMKDVKMENRFEAQVNRRFRAFLTTGFLSSSLNEHKFERQNLLAADGTTYSTFVDMREAKSLAFAPVVFSHMTLGSLADIGLKPLSGVSIAISGGVAARSVNARISPDFLLGTSLGVRDRVALTLAWHTGRVEHLIIGDPKEVRKSAVPTTITREGAVGERWAGGFAISFSVSM